jgi:hypothetical protein
MFLNIRFLIVVIASAAAAGTGCGGDDGSRDASGGATVTTQSGQSPTSTTRKNGVGAKRTSGKRKAFTPKSPAAARLIERRAEAFRKARKVCRSHTVAELARRYEARIRNPVEVARAYATGAYSLSVQPGAFEGCLAGFSAASP